MNDKEQEIAQYSMDVIKALSGVPDEYIFDALAICGLSVLSSISKLSVDELIDDDIASEIADLIDDKSFVSGLACLLYVVSNTTEVLRRRLELNKFNFDIKSE